MSRDEEPSALVALWLGKAGDALDSAELELRAGHVSFAVNRLYYCCFYAVTALLLKEGKQFARHSRVLAEFNRSFVRTGQVEQSWGKFYHALFEDRQEEDYLPLVKFEAADISVRLDQAREFLDIMRSLINPDG
jgi:uncharacterized protein (UPF0332 family)